MFPMWVAKEIMLACIIGNISRGILKECVKRFPGGNTSGPKYLQIEGRAEILLVAASQWANMCSDTFKGVLLGRRGKGLRRTSGNMYGVMG